MIANTAISVNPAPGDGQGAQFLEPLGHPFSGKNALDREQAHAVNDDTYCDHRSTYQQLLIEGRADDLRIIGQAVGHRFASVSGSRSPS